MPFFRLFFGLLLIFLAQFSFAQLPNEAFYKQPEAIDNFNGWNDEGTAPTTYEIFKNSEQLRFEFNSFGFFKDNEYFNKIADGYTLFGYQLAPSLKYIASEKIKVEAGLLVLKDFGNRKYKLIQPTFTATYFSKKHTFRFGTINGNLNFGYIEPLWDFERQLTTPIQNGIQYIYKGNKLDLQTWVDWQVMQYAYDTKQEEIAGGFISNIKLWQKNNKYGHDVSMHRGDAPRIEYYEIPTFIVNLPLQFTAKHKGGQIDVNDAPLTTLFNGATGLEITKHFNGYHGVRQYSVYTKNYFVGYSDHSFTHQLPFKSGSGIYLNAGADTRWANLMLSYWNGNGYISEFGGKLYQSVSTTVKNPDYIERNRQLLILRIMKDWKMEDDYSNFSGLTFSGRIEPFYDFNTKSIEFSAGIYVHFNTDFFLTEPEKNKAY